MDIFHCFGQLNVDLNKSFTIVINTTEFDYCKPLILFDTLTSKSDVMSNFPFFFKGANHLARRPHDLG